MTSKKAIKDKLKLSLPKKGFFSLVVLAIFSFAFTVFVLLNAYEQIFFRDIPYLETLREYPHSDDLNQVVSKVDGSAEFLHHLVKDVPRYITLPSINSSIELTSDLYRDGKYYVRGNKGHVIKKKNSNTLIVYLDENWRTTTDLSLLKEDELLFILSYEYNYIFKIDRVVKNIEDFRPSDVEALKPEVVLIGAGKSSFTIVTATLVNSVHR